MRKKKKIIKRDEIFREEIAQGIGTACQELSVFVLRDDTSTARIFP